MRPGGRFFVRRVWAGCLTFNWAELSWRMQVRVARQWVHPPGLSLRLQSGKWTVLLERDTVCYNTADCVSRGGGKENEQQKQQQQSKIWDNWHPTHPHWSITLGWSHQHITPGETNETVKVFSEIYVVKLTISLDFVPLLNSSETRITVVVMPSYELVKRVVTQKCCHTNNKPITLNSEPHRGK